jgi:hypothetical protein
MGTVPEAYREFVMHYAPYFYVIPTSITVDAAEGQKNVTVADDTKFQAGFPVEIKDDTHAEWNEGDSVAGEYDRSILADLETFMNRTFYGQEELITTIVSEFTNCVVPGTYSVNI